jgi:cytochrome c-type biogenesis protein CcmH/NrfG
VNDLTIGLLSALLATNQPQAVSNLIQQNTGASVTIVNPDDPAEQELRKLMIADDAATTEVDTWIRDNDALTAKGAGESKQELNRRILARFDSVRKNYEDFLRSHPNNARGYLAYGSFLNDIGDEEAAMLQYENARQIDPNNPAAWNNLANYYGEHGPITNAFAYYARAIELDPREPVYYQNFATTVYLYRKDAREFYGINEQQVFDKALELYRKAVQLDPDNFPLATDYAQSYYGIRPLRTNDALVAWTNALQIAHDDNEREGVYIHLARIKIAAGRYDEARAQLDAVTNAAFAGLKDRLERSLVAHENAATNPVVPAPKNNLAELSTNISIALTNVATVVSNKMIVPTNSPPFLTNEAPALPNPPAFPTNNVSVLTNVPPVPPPASNLSPDLLKAPPVLLRPIPPASLP